MPKVKGVKKFTLYMSTKSDKGYKKVKKVKPGKTVVISKFKNKAFKKENIIIIMLFLIKMKQD